MFYRQHKTFWYQFCNLKHFLKAENSEDIFASSCEQNSVTFHVTQSGLSYYWNYTNYSSRNNSFYFHREHLTVPRTQRRELHDRTVNQEP